MVSTTTTTADSGARRARPHPRHRFGPVAVAAMLAFGAILAGGPASPASATSPAGSATGIDAQLGLGFTINGTISATDPNAVLDGLAIYVVGADGTHSGNANPDGTFTVTGIAAGDHTVQFDAAGSPLLGGFYNSALPGGLAPDEATAEHLAIAADLAGVDVTLTVGFTLGGTMRSSAGPIKDVSVLLMKPGTRLDGPVVNSTNTLADGSFSMIGIPPGTYVVATQTAGYVDGWYREAAAGRFTTDPDAATRIVLGPSGQIQEMTLPRGFAISGRLTAANGRPPSFTWVIPDGGPQTSHVALSNPATGRYRVAHLAPGAYRLRIMPDNQLAGPAGWYTNQNASHFTTSKAKATLVTVRHDRTAINATLPRGHTVSGIVRDGTGNPVRDAIVRIGGNWATTTATGRFAVRGLATGTYRIEVQAPLARNLQSGWYAGGAPGHFTPTKAAASRIRVAGSISGLTIRLPRGYSVSGTVTAGPGAVVWVVVTGPERAVEVRPAADGRYRVFGLSPGAYTVRFDAEAPLASGWYTTATPSHTTPDRALATEVSVGP